jgi:uncharacterized protein YukE
MARHLEILGTSVTVPDPDSVASLSASFSSVSENLTDLVDMLQALSTPAAWGEWTGQAANAFGQSIGQLPGELGAAQEAYGTAAAALQDYASHVEPVVTALTSLSFQADDAESTLTAIQNARNQVIHQGQDPAATGWDARLADATEAVSELSGQLTQLLAELHALSSRCVAQINGAAPKQAKSLLGSLASDFMKDVADPLGRAAEAAAHTGLGIGEELLRAYEHPTVVVGALVVHPFSHLVKDAEGIARASPLEALGSTLGDVAGVLGVLSLIPGVDLIAAPALLVVSAAAAASDWAAVATHEKGASVAGATLASLSLGLAGTGAVIGKGVATGDKLIDAAAEAGDTRQVVSLATGQDARESAGALRKSGVKQLFSWTDVKDSVSEGFGQVRGNLSDVKGSLTSATELRSTLNSAADSVASKANNFLRLGSDGLTHSPAAVVLQHAQFIGTQAGNAVGVASDQVAESQPG